MNDERLEKFNSEVACLLSLFSFSLHVPELKSNNGHNHNYDYHANKSWQLVPCVHKDFIISCDLPGSF